MTTRRSFLKATSVLSASFLIAPPDFKDTKPTIGLQLYTVRDAMAADPLGTLAKVAAVGYNSVEGATYTGSEKFYGMIPGEFKKVLKKNGLMIQSSHYRLGEDKEKGGIVKGTILHDWDRAVDDATEAGIKYLVCAYLSETERGDLDHYKKIVEDLNKAGERCKKSGIQLCYHNHDFEFKFSLNGKLVYDIILDNTDPKLVIQQMDIGNMYGAGGRALEILKKHPGRFKSMHVKDEIKSTTGAEMNDKYVSTILGKGILPVHEIVNQFKEKGGTTEFIIEQESYQGIQPVDCAKEDLKVMKSWGF